MAEQARVALVKIPDGTTGEELETARIAAVRSVIDQLGCNPVAGKRVLLKPNFNTADPAPGSTPNNTWTTMVQKLREMGARDVALVERSGPPLTVDVLAAKGVPPLLAELGCEFIDLDEHDVEDWVKFVPEGGHWPDGFIYPRVIRDAECIVTTCCLKTHRMGGVFSLSLKLAVGLVPRRGYNYMHQMHYSPHMRKMIAEINLCYQPSLIVLDGVHAFVTGGPEIGERVQANVMVAGTDRVAVDAVGLAVLKLLGTTPEIQDHPIFSQEQIAHAAKLGLGVSSPEQIEIVPADAESALYADQLRQILSQG